MRYWKIKYFFRSGLLSGGTTLMQIPITQLVAKLLEKYNLQRTLQIYAVASTVICFFGSLAYIPTNFPADEKLETSKTKSTTKNYKHLLKNTVFRFWLFVSIIIFFEYSVSSVHQVSGEFEDLSVENKSRRAARKDSHSHHLV